MWEIRIYSRGGQGAVTAATILTEIAIEEGKFAQAIPSYGQERKGAPVYTYARISENPIEVKSYVYTPNVVIVFDRSLAEMGIDFYEGLQEDSILIVNSERLEEFEHASIGKYVTVDADEITRSEVGNAPPNLVMLAALARATGCISIDHLTDYIRRVFKDRKGEENAKACRRAYEEVLINA